MNNNKVIYDGQTIMDISDSTTSSNNLLQGEIGYSGNGDRVVGSVIAGHTIQNDSGSDMQRRDKLQFKGVYVEDDQPNDVTKVDICRTMTKAQMEALSGEAIKGFINTSDEPDSLPLTTDWVETDNGDSLTDRISDIEQGIYDADLTNKGITIPNKSGTLALTSDFIPLGQTQNITATELDGLYNKNVIRMGYLNSSNMPFNSVWGTIINQTDVVSSTRVCNQILITQSGIAMRHYEGSSWSAWKKTSFA